ncbi:hypothetical protein N9Y26_00585 [bacterium]|nr:hypothetical protein [bacterium]
MILSRDLPILVNHAFLLIVLSYGMETAFFRFSQREPNKKVVYSTALISLVLSSTLFVALIYLNAQSIATALSFPQGGITYPYGNIQYHGEDFNQLTFNPNYDSFESSIIVIRVCFK